MKKMLLGLLAALGVFAFAPSSANAATCFWVGAGATWNTAANWSSSSGGAGSTCAATGGVPKNAGDNATFDGSSGVGTVNFDSSTNGVALGTITAGAFAGTLDNTLNNVNITAQVITINGAGAKTFNCGTGTFTLNGANTLVWDAQGTNTLSCASGTIVLASPVTFGTQSVNWGTGKTYGTVTIQGRGTISSTFVLVSMSLTGADTFTNFNISGPVRVSFQSAGPTWTVGTANFVGAANQLIDIHPQSSSANFAMSITTASTLKWVALQGATFSTTAVNCTSCFDQGGNNMNGGSIVSPSTGGSHIIGG